MHGAESVDSFRARLEDGDRWIEVVDGRLVRLSPPDEVHGNIVRNVAQRLAKCLRKSPTLYPAYELGLIVAREPLTIRSPAIAVFAVEQGLLVADQLVTGERPELIVEAASSNDRREAMSARIDRYLEWGVREIWVFDPQSQHVHVHRERQSPRMLKPVESLRGSLVVPAFDVLVADIFADPAWLARRPADLN